MSNATKAPKAPEVAEAPKVCTVLLRAAAWLAPCDVRTEWFREWHGEMRYAALRLARSGATDVAPSVRLIARCTGAFVHAAWLRWDRWRPEMLLQDIKYALRTLLKRPGFATTAVLTLAIGIGANAAIFSAVRAVLLRPLPFPQPEQLVRVFKTSIKQPDRVGGTASAPDFVDWRTGNTSFIDLAAIDAGSYALTGVGTAEQVAGANVTGGFFNVLAVPAVYGRTLLPEDDRIGEPAVVVVGYGLWARRFGSDPRAVGQIASIDGTDYRIVGVMPRGFAYPLRSELWMPRRFTTNELTTQRGAHYLDVIGRLKPGVPLQQAREEMSAIALRLAEEYPDTNGNSRISVHEMRTAMVGNVRTPMLVLLGAVGFVLLIVCVNVANLVLTRALGRTRELAVRSALGAGRWRLVRGVMVESLVLGLTGGLAGLTLAIWASQGISSLESGLGIPLLDGTRVDNTVIAFTFGVSFAAALLFGSLPAWLTSSITDVAARIRENSGTLTGDRHRQRLRSLLIVTETALAVVLLVGAGLLMRSFVEMSTVELGFDATRLQTFSVSLPDAKYATPSQRAAFIERLVADAANQPGVEAAGAIFGLPLTDFRYVISMSTLDGRRLQSDEQYARSLQVRVVTPDYFRSMTIPIVRGRPFRAEDRAGAAHVVVINEAAAAMLWPTEEALGHEFTLGTRMGQGGENAGGMVVGIARNVRDHGPTEAVRPTVYLSHAQFSTGFMTVTVKSRAESPALLESLRAVLARVDPDVPMFRVRTMEQIAADAVAQPRVYLLLLSLFAGAAVLLAAIGIYGVLMHAVAQRTREIGIRLALGAERREVVGLVVRQAGALAIGGLVVGLIMALGASRLMRGLLFGIEPTDAVTYLLVAVGLFGMAMLASYLPARRASRIDPVKALRYE